MRHVDGMCVHLLGGGLHDGCRGGRGDVLDVTQLDFAAHATEVGAVAGQHHRNRAAGLAGAASAAAAMQERLCIAWQVVMHHLQD